MDINEYSRVDVFPTVSYAIIGVSMQSTGMNSKNSSMETLFQHTTVLGRISQRMDNP
jgi:hypothetical protein